jgi:hypothetical protein
MTGEGPPGSPPEGAAEKSPAATRDAASLTPESGASAPLAPASSSAPPLSADEREAPTSAASSVVPDNREAPIEPASERRERLRARIRAFQILLALGVFSAITGAVISVSLAFALRSVVLALPGVIHDVAVITIARLWAWAVAPLAAWGAGRVLNARPWVIAFSISAWGEVLYVMFDLAIMGFAAGVYRSPGYFSGRAVTLGLGMLFGWLLAKHGRAAADRVKARHEAEAEATRQRYAKWLEEQTSGR